MKKGFTLIELLIVIAIIAILAAILFVSIGTTPLEQSRDAKRVSDLQNLRTALTLYFTDNDQYPADDDLGSLVPSYMATEPKDPFDNNPSSERCGDDYTPNFPDTAAYSADDYGYLYSSLDTGGAACTSSEICTGFRLAACLETDSKALDNDCDTNPCQANPIYDIYVAP